MALEFAIKEVEARPTACIRTKTTMDKLAARGRRGSS